MTTIAPNRSVVSGTVVGTRAHELDVQVTATRAAWPRVQDLAADYLGRVLTVRVAADTAGLTSGRAVEIECSLEAVGNAPTWVAATVR